MLLAKEMGARSLLVKSNSLLVIGQATSEYQANDPQMASYLKYVMLLKETFAAFELVHVPREHNARDNLVTKLVSSGRGGRQRTVIQETLKEPRTTTGCVEKVQQVSVFEGGRRGHQSLTQETLRVRKVSVYDSSGGESLDVFLVDVSETCMTPYRRYLAYGLLS